MAKKKPEAAEARETHFNSTWKYSDVPTSLALMEVIARMPQLPLTWADMRTYQGKMCAWHSELRQAAQWCCAAANDATGIMVDVIDGKRPLDSEATKALAMVCAIRA